MTISRPDYSRLQNAISTKNAINEREVAREAERKNASIQGYVKGTMNLIKGAAGLAVDYITTQDAAQQARLKPELEAKSTYYNQLLNESIKNGTTTISKDESGRTVVNYAPEVLEYRNSWMDDINSRDEISTRTKDWASKQMDAVYNMSDEQVLYTIAANNATLASTDMDKTVTQAAIISAQQGDPSYLEQTISGLQISDQYKQAYLQDGMSIYDSEYQSLHSRDLAVTEGLQASYRYIDNLPEDTATKNTLKNNALSAYTTNMQAISSDTQRNVKSMLEEGKSWTEIQQTLIPQGQNADERDLITDTIKALQSEQVTSLCAPYLAQVQSGTATTEQLQDIKTLLKQSKYMFSGGLEGTYETYMGMVDNAITESKNRKSDYYADANLFGQYLYNQWNQGNISGDDAISQMKAYGETHADELDVVNVMDNFVNQIIADKVPLRYRDYFKMKMSDFSTLYSSQAKALGYQPMNDDYTANYETLYKDTINFISANPDMTLEDIDTFMDTEMDGFFARYADAKALADSQIPAAEPVPVEVNPTDVKNSADTVMNNWDAGLYSKDQAIEYLSALLETTTDTSVAKNISDHIATIQTKKVPDAWKSSYEEAVKNFDNRYVRMMDVKKLDDLDDDQYVSYLDNKTYYEGALADYISKNHGLSQTDINREAQKLIETFSQPYATKDTTLEWKVDTVGSQTGSFLDTLKSFEETIPFRYNYNQVTGKIEYEWVNDKASANWDNAGRYGLQALRNAGYDVSTYETFEYGGSAYPIMVFRSSDGKAQYTIDTNTGNVMEIRSQTIGGNKVLSMIEVTPVQTQNAGISRGAQTPGGAPNGYVFDETSMGGEATNPASAGGASFAGQQKAIDSAQKAEEARQQEEERRQNDEEFANRNSGNLTSTQLAYVSELEAQGYSYDEAYQLAPLVDRYRTEGGLPWEEAIGKALQELGISRKTSEEKENPEKKKTVPQQGFKAW